MGKEVQVKTVIYGTKNGKHFAKSFIDNGESDESESMPKPENKNKVCASCGTAISNKYVVCKDCNATAKAVEKAKKKQ